MSEHEKWMAEALAQAQTAIYRARPNPAVGCVIVKNDRIIGRGATAPVGGSHAEVFALTEAGEQAEGATAYVTLEPCAHYGRTPPCAEALVKAKVSRVVIATLDPNPLVAGKGQAILQQAGIKTIVGVLESQAIELNRGFLKVMAGGLPYVRLKIAASLDGRTAMASGESKWITGAAARQDVQHFRAISGAVITGIATILADDAQLNVRHLENIDLNQIVQPYRIILDRQGRLPLDAKVLQNPETVMVMTPYREDLAKLGVLQLSVQSLIDLLGLLKSQYQIYDVLVEAGATLVSSFLAEKLVDEVIQYIAPMYLGQTARPLNQFSFSTMQQRLNLNLFEITQILPDVRLRLKPIYE
ncbi:MAG: bifunctional diaminohydroxyphosphoribosylaminopyrimidine deaminase/5-amino-6-(5-phosphoribosylamino)uracil reductase RibD [Acinetobacter populi]|jgi:diaminohydroxyphosphoribosylaminopyrimidine deaminase/5-amino-6-(5-phosphoribosylamino)uracil reductase|uniref:bifunctional diaminohydroxyphosphoribosylaminopyrimidine deaminase/5-amino-6-(5-phosphoribosylamino)uracil reductase RibD n=1 Tax=Acinetobacter populi TaxID=1582270 RepID=UPI0023572EC4|nr:bifunctional diaminohydroxyphosphoribosylaminopyrimidine deaminase/5-amino-6-(5-phosphoribosylamino)uracil reductase RibD [Acinetobacter populi]MCH4249014.1 bifunctional diaminohydroxyphosphoribosylaminopyrimidine deaminase/5-amino-6-(5-phosphoribosylamino)uracil reductase RibD [Acinetobacter populi]